MPAQSSPYAKNAVLIALGTTIRRVRRARHISQERLALETEIDRSYLGAIERDSYGLPIVIWAPAPLPAPQLVPLAMRS